MSLDLYPDTIFVVFTNRWSMMSTSTVQVTDEDKIVAVPASLLFRLALFPDLTTLRGDSDNCVSNNAPAFRF